MATNCEEKHLRLAGIIVIIILAVVGAALGYSINRMGGYEERLRQAELTQVKIVTVLDQLNVMLKKIETKLDQGEKK